MTKPFPPEQPPRQGPAGAARSAASALIRPVAGIAVVVALGLAAYWYLVVHKSDDDIKDSMPAAGKCFSWSDDDGAA